MNVFYCNGAVSLIVATALIEKNFNHQYNVLIIEMDYTKAIPSSFTGSTSNYFTIIDIIARSSVWDMVVHVEVKNLFISFESLAWIFSILPVKNIRIILNKRKAIKSIKNIIRELTKQDKLIVSDNSILWKHFYDNQCDLSLIEHGAASYRSGIGVERNWKYFIKAAYSALTNTNLNIKADSIYLSDNNRSFKVSSYKENKIGCRPISLDLGVNVRDLFKNFLLNYELECPEAYSELVEIKNTYKYIYIYLPTGIVPDDEYDKYIKSQILQIDNLEDDAVFLIKSHNNDGKRKYFKYFKDLGLASVGFNVSINKYIPAEILLFFFPRSIVVSSYSSTHLYSNWWLNKKTIFAEVEDASVQDILTSEYRSVYEDLQSLKLKKDLK